MSGESNGAGASQRSVRLDDSQEVGRVTAEGRPDRVTAALDGDGRGGLSRGERALLALGLLDETGPSAADGREVDEDPLHAADEVWFEAADLADASRVELGVSHLSFQAGLGAPLFSQPRGSDEDDADPRHPSSRNRPLRLEFDLGSSAIFESRQYGHQMTDRHPQTQRSDETRAELKREAGWPGPSAALNSPLPPRIAGVLVGAPAGSVIEWSCESRPLALALASQLAMRWAHVAAGSSRAAPQVFACWPGPLSQVRAVLRARACGVDLRWAGELDASSCPDPELASTLAGLLEQRIRSVAPREDLRGDRFLRALENALGTEDALGTQATSPRVRLIVLGSQAAYLALGEAQDEGARRAWWESLAGVASRAGAIVFYIHHADQRHDGALMRWRLERDAEVSAPGRGSWRRLSLEHDNLLGDDCSVDLRWWPRLALLEPVPEEDEPEPRVGAPRT